MAQVRELIKAITEKLNVLKKDQKINNNYYNEMNCLDVDRNIVFNFKHSTNNRIMLIETL